MTDRPDAARQSLALQLLPPLLRALFFGTQTAVPCDACIQTHISWVLLAGDYAYKFKKPLKLAFLDFSTLALRKHYCEEELRLNRRYAPDLYLEVLPVYGTPAHPSWGGTGEPIEYALRMRRFDDSARLDRVCERGELLPAHLTGLARSVVAFHQSAQVTRPGSAFGSVATIRQQAFDNLDALCGVATDAAMSERLRALRQWTEQQCSLLGPLMERRQQQGWVRECHGDLHLGNMVLRDEKVTLFDCLEFSEELRWIDVASDLAFTWVDLLAHQRPGLASWFLNEALLWSGDYASAPLLRFYAVYRALVRAKVAALQSSPNPSSAAVDYLALAQGLVTPQRLSLRITHGLSGCGKTFASNALLQSDASANTLRLRTDAQRKRRFHHGLLEKTGSALESGMYAPSESAKTYAQLLELARDLLRAQWSVLVDGTFLHRAQRDAFGQLAAEEGVDFSIIAPQAPLAVLRERVSRRQQSGEDPSEATLEVLAHQLEVLQPLEADEPVWPLVASPKH